MKSCTTVTTLKKLALAIAVLAITAGATSAHGGISLTNIPFAECFTNSSGMPDTGNEGRAITYDGRYVVGLSSPSGKGFFYDVANNTNYWPIGGGAEARPVTGVGYRTNLSSQLEVVLSGLTSSGYGNWMTTDGGATWGAKRRDTNMGDSPWKVPAANGLAGTPSDVFYSTFYDSPSSGIINWYVGQFSGAWPMTPVWGDKNITDTMSPQATGISSTGRAVGYRRTTAGGPLLNYYYNWVGATTPSGAAFNGLDGSQKGQAYSVSADGNTIFGMSPTVSDQVNNYGYKVVNPGGSQTTTPLPEFPDTGGSTSRGIPYGCTVDGKYAAGMNYRGMEKAVIWDTSSADANNWTVVDLTDLASANCGLDIFGGNLRRAYSIGTNAAGDLVITGRGYSPSDANYRAFLMTVPKWVAGIQFPISQTVNYGSNVTFSLRTNGTDSLTYQWLKYGTNLPGATTTALSFTGVSCAGGEAGNYQVVVTNTSISGVVTSGVARLTVLDPFISAQPSSRTNLEATAATFTVSAGGAPTLSYRWQRGGSDLTDGDTGWGSIIAGATTATLTISNVTFTDTYYGDYTVVVTTSAGGCTATSRAVTLLVVGRPVLSGIVADYLGNYTLNVSGPSGQLYEVLYSTDIALPLINWTPLVTNTFSGGLDTYVDIAAPDPQRFYILTSPYVLTSP